MKYDTKNCVLHLDPTFVECKLQRNNNASLFFYFQEQALDNVQTALKEAVGGSKPMKFKSTVNEQGATVVQVTIKGSNPSSWLEARVKEAMDSLMSR